MVAAERNKADVRAWTLARLWQAGTLALSILAGARVAIAQYAPIPNFVGTQAGAQFRGAVNDRLSGQVPIAPTTLAYKAQPSSNTCYSGGADSGGNAEISEQVLTLCGNGLNINTALVWGAAGGPNRKHIYYIRQPASGTIDTWSLSVIAGASMVCPSGSCPDSAADYPANACTKNNCTDVVEVDYAAPLNMYIVTVNDAGGWAISGGGASGNPPPVVGETPSGVVDGVNAVFTLAGPTITVGSERVQVNGLRQVSSIDYTIAGTVITFTSAPIPGDIIRVDYGR